MVSLTYPSTTQSVCESLGAPCNRPSLSLSGESRHLGDFSITFSFFTPAADCRRFFRADQPPQREREHRHGRLTSSCRLFPGERRHASPLRELEKLWDVPLVSPLFFNRPLPVQRHGKYVRQFGVKNQQTHTKSKGECRFGQMQKGAGWSQKSQ